MVVLTKVSVDPRIRGAGDSRAQTNTLYANMPIFLRLVSIQAVISDEPMTRQWSTEPTSASMSTASSCFANLMIRTRAYNLKPTDADAISEKATEVPTIRLKVD